jgi:GABA(A) receptor-associated protein
MNRFKYQKEHNFEKRKGESSRIKLKYPDKVPTIVEISESTKDITLDKKKYLVPVDLSVGQFSYTLRKRIDLAPEEALFLFVSGETLVPTSMPMSEIYSEHKNEDGFLYFLVSKEATFGN